MNITDYLLVIDNIKAICKTTSNSFFIVKKNDEIIDYQLDFLEDKIKYLSKTEFQKTLFIYDFKKSCFLDKEGIATPQKIESYLSIFNKVMADIQVNKAKIYFKLEEVPLADSSITET